MKRHILAFFFCLPVFFAWTQENNPTVYVDKKGVMRWTDTQEETSFFGVNYTLPFAHAYRAMNYLNKDHKAAIDRDVYHFARLGFNAYRIHIWDVEISDLEGNLIENDHLDLLDYLIYKLKERNIRVLLTAMTNFGNGYPERNQLTGAFSYAYDKCNIHEHPEAIKAQQRYVSQLVKHVNPYTGLAYMKDPDVVGFEINNEPCHSGTQKQTKDYINGMVDALKKAGNRKPVFYNVSHNKEQIEAYYASSVQGTTYQWYPIGLVAGRTRQGNFLPYIDEYYIPFSDVKGFANKAKLVYEYDPADNLYSYIHPAMARSFRTAGFQWVTQFAYDPIDMAQFNTEYQTHYLNLAYTPQKAISMKIAAEVAYTVPRNKKYEKYPNDTIFEDFRVSYELDLSELNRTDKFYYSNHTDTRPVNADELTSVAGYGCSPLVSYEGRGAYFLDKLEEGLWRLEVMPDAVQVSDPFAKPTLEKEVVTILWGSWNMQVSLPDLGCAFAVTGLNEGNSYQKNVEDEVIPAVTPGVYLLKRKGITLANDWNRDSRWEYIRLGEFVAPQTHTDFYTVNHQAAKNIEKEKPLVIEAEITGPAFPDSVIVYTDKVSFWSDRNLFYKMERVNGYTYRVIIPGSEITKNRFRYNIVVCQADQQFTFPEGLKGAPLDWDYTSDKYWESSALGPDTAIKLFAVTDEYSGMETYAMPECRKIRREVVRSSPWEEQTLKASFESPEEDPRFFLHTYIKDEITGQLERVARSNYLCLHVKQAPEKIQVGFVTDRGFTYVAPVEKTPGIVRIPLTTLQQTKTALLPHPYPVFLKEFFEPDVELPFRMQEVEKIEISWEGEKGKMSEIEIGSIWLE